MDIFKNNFIKKIIKKYSIYIYKNCDHIISQSDGIKKKLNKYLENKVKITVIRNWPELEFSDKKESKKIDFPKKNINNFDILFSGNIGEAQDMESVLECVKISKKDKKIRWIFLGSGSKFLWLKQKKIENNLENLFLLGNKPSNQMMQYYSLSDALLISLKPGPAFKIVVPSKFVSYLKSSKPIVGMIDGETNNIINDNKIGYSCRAGDYFELFNNIKKLKKNYKKKLYFFKKNSEKLFNKSFKRDNQILKIINVINEVK